MIYKDIFNRIKHWWMRLRLQPIQVFCFHQVSETFDESTMWECDWMSAEDFRNKITNMQSEYTFISIEKATSKLKQDWFRRKKYAVLTADDGSKTIECILPWLLEQQIPLTMFLNGSYLDGKTYRLSPAERYFTLEDLQSLENDLIRFGHHGWNHKDIQTLTIDEFKESISKNQESLQHIPHSINYWAYPYGTHSSISDRILKEQNFIPVYMDGQKNYNDDSCIHRELL